MDEQILYTVNENHMRLYIHVDNPSLKYIKGDNEREIIRSVD